MPLVTNVFRRGGSYYFRTRFPEHLRAIVGRRELWRSLRVGDPLEARQRASLVAQLTFRLWRDIEHMARERPIDRGAIKRLIDDWTTAQLVDDENLRAPGHQIIHPGVIMRRRGEGESDFQGEVLTARGVKAFHQLSLEAKAKRLGDDGHFQADVNDADLRIAARDQVLQGAHIRRRRNDGSHLADQINTLLVDAGVSVERDSPEFETAKELLLRAQSDLRDAINRRTLTGWRPNLDDDPASPFIATLNPPRTGVQHAAQVTQPSPSSSPASSTIVATDRLAMVVHQMGLEVTKTGTFLPGRAKEYGKAVGLFLHWAGKDLRAGDVTAQMAGQFRAALPRYPTNANKIPAFRGLSFDAQVSLADSLGSPTLSVTTANGNYLTPLRLIFDWAIATGKVALNPFEAARIATGKKSIKQARRDFTDGEIRALLAHPVFTGSLRSEYEGLYLPGTFRTDGWRYWLPLIGMLSGARLNELAGLQIDDFQEIGGVATFHVQAKAKGQRIKSKAADRIVPVHQTLIDLGLLDRVAQMKMDKEAQLFPDLSLGPSGYFSDKPTRFFARLIDRTCGDDPELVFHSLRHSFVTKMREAGIPKELRTAVVGHEGGDTHDGYGHEPIKRLNEAVQSVVWTGVDFASIRLSVPQRPI